MTAATMFDGNPFVRAESVAAAKAEAFALLQKFLPMNYHEAEDWIAQHPPSAGAIVMLPFMAYDILTRETRRAFALRNSRKDSLMAKVRALNLTSVADARKRAPDLFAATSPTVDLRTLYQAISRNKQQKRRQKLR